MKSIKVPSAVIARVAGKYTDAPRLRSVIFAERDLPDAVRAADAVRAIVREIERGVSAAVGLPREIIDVPPKARRDPSEF